MWINLYIEKCTNMTNEMPKVRVYATIREDLVKWLDEQVENLKFATRSHGIEVALQKLLQQQKEENPEK